MHAVKGRLGLLLFTFTKPRATARNIDVYRGLCWSY